MQENKINILSTRPLHDTVIHKAAHKNIFIDAVSFIETEVINTGELVKNIQSFASQKIIAIFTSINAVEAVIKHLAEQPEWKVFSMGGITKELVIQFFGETSLLGSAKNATVLAERIIEAGNVNEVVFFCGDQRLDELPQTLAAHNIKVNEVIVYTTIQTPKEIDKPYNGIIFFSPSAVHSFFSVNTIAMSVILFAIGKTTAATIRSYVKNEVVMSEWPGKDQMVEQAIQYFSTIKQV